MCVYTLVQKGPTLSSCQDCSCHPLPKGTASDWHAELEAACHLDVAPCICATVYTLTCLLYTMPPCLLEDRTIVKHHFP